MDVKESLQRFGLVPMDESLETIRAVLKHEADAERASMERADDLALLCCVQLFSRGLLEDVLRIWDAKESGWDMFRYLDGQLLCGAGLDQTKRFLEGQRHPEAARALTYLNDMEMSGDFDGFSPESYLEKFSRYFEVEVKLPMR